MSRYTYHFLITALFFATALVIVDYLQNPITGLIMLSFGVLFAIAGVAGDTSGHRR